MDQRTNAESPGNEQAGTGSRSPLRLDPGPFGDPKGLVERTPSFWRAVVDWLSRCDITVVGLVLGIAGLCFCGYLFASGAEDMPQRRFWGLLVVAVLLFTIVLCALFLGHADRAKNRQKSRDAADEPGDE